MKKGELTTSQLETFKTTELKGHKSKVQSVSWNSLGSKLASGSMDRSIRLWTVDKETSSVELKGHTDFVNQLRWSHNDTLVSVSTDKTVRFWDHKSGSCINKIATPGQNINLCWNPSGTELAIVDKDNLILIIDCRTFTIEYKKQFPYEVNELVWNKDGSLLYITTGLGGITILNTEDKSYNEVMSLQAHTANAYCIDFDPNGRYFAVGAADALVSLWDAHEYICLKTFAKLDCPIHAISFTFDGKFIASGSEDRFIDISNVKSGQNTHRIVTNTPTNTLSWHPKQYILAYSGDDESNSSQTGMIKLFGWPSNI